MSGIGRASVALWLAVLLAGAAEAQTKSARPGAAEAEAAIGELRSPYCPGLMLEVCPSPEAAALRDSIYVLAEGGSRRGEIVDWVLARHGEEWRGVPQKRGAGLWAWAIPVLVLAGGAAWVIARLRSTRGTGEPPAPSAPLADEERERVAVAMRSWEASGEVEP